MPLGSTADSGAIMRRVSVFGGRFPGAMQTISFILAAGISGVYGTSAVMAQSTPDAAGITQSVQKARGVLKYAKGRYCPSLFCTFSGYDISAIDLTDDGQTIVFIHDDGTRGDKLPVRSLNPRDLGLGVIGFTGGFEPQLVTTSVEVQRLIAALNTVKQAPSAALASRPTQTTLAPAAALVTAPANVTAATPPPPVTTPPQVAAATPTSASSGYAGKRLAVKTIGSCAPDPDPLGVSTSDSDYPDCDQELLDGLHAKISIALASRGFQVNDNNPDAILTVTLILLMDDEGAAGVLDLGATGYHAEARYQLSGSKGQLLRSGTIKSADPNNVDDENYEPVEVKLAQEIAAALPAPGTAQTPAAIAASIIPTYAGMSAGTATFLREIGVDPTSADVTSIAKDDASGINLNSLAANHDAQGVKRFIATRAFLHKFLINSNTPFPPPDLYDVQYLTKVEQTLIANQIKKEFGVAPGQ